MDTIQKIYLHRKLSVFPSFTFSQFKNRENNMLHVATMTKNIMSLGFILSEDLMEYLSELSVAGIENFNTWLVENLNEMVGNDRVYVPFYPGFPDEVMDFGVFEQFLTFLHYVTNGEYRPPREEYDTDREEVESPKKFAVINLGTEADFVGMILDIIQSNGSISSDDSEALSQLFSYATRRYIRNILSLVREIPNKEVLSFVTSLVIKNKIGFDMTPFFKTATDVLRLAVALSDGDVSLTGNTRFISFRRYERRILMSLIENSSHDSNGILEDMQRHTGMWKRFAHGLHVGEFSTSHPNTYFAVYRLRNGNVLPTFHSKLEEAFDAKDIGKVVDLLLSRPGEFARSIDRVLRTFDSGHRYILNNFERVVDEVSTPVLLQLMGHIRARNTKEFRIIVPKGKTSKTKVLPNNVKRIDNSSIFGVEYIIENALIERFEGYGGLGRVYVDPLLSGVALPASQRSASSALKMLPRGSSFHLNTYANYLRVFINWFNTGDRDEDYSKQVDLDLGAMFYSEDWEEMGSIFWNGNIHDKFLNCYHSGDVVNAPRPDGAQEFIDIDINRVAEKGIRYVVFTVNSYRGQTFCEPNMDAIFGWMEREDNEAGRVYEPSTVTQKANLTSDSVASVPVIFDLLEMKALWVDTNVATHRNQRYLTVRMLKDNPLIQALMSYDKCRVSLGELINLHAVARGLDIVENPDEADTVFGFDTGHVTAFDTEYILSELMK